MCLTNACIRRSSKTRRSNCSFFNAETERRGEGGRKKEEGENAERRTLNSEVVREGEIAREGTKRAKACPLNFQSSKRSRTHRLLLSHIAGRGRPAPERSKKPRRNLRHTSARLPAPAGWLCLFPPNGTQAGRMGPQAPLQGASLTVLARRKPRLSSNRSVRIRIFIT